MARMLHFTFAKKNLGGGNAPFCQLERKGEAAKEGKKLR